MASKKNIEQFALAILPQLPPKAAAWLLNRSPRWLRDRVDVPRNLDGTYDARALLAYAKGAWSQRAVDSKSVGFRFESGDLITICVGRQAVFVRVLGEPLKLDVDFGAIVKFEKDCDSSGDDSE